MQVVATVHGNYRAESNVLKPMPIEMPCENLTSQRHSINEIFNVFKWNFDEFIGRVCLRTS